MMKLVAMARNNGLVGNSNRFKPANMKCTTFKLVKMVKRLRNRRSSLIVRKRLLSKLAIIMPMALPYISYQLTSVGLVGNGILVGHHMF